MLFSCKENNMSDNDDVFERRREEYSREENQCYWREQDERAAKEMRDKMFWDATLRGEHNRALAALGLPVPFPPTSGSDVGDNSPAGNSSSGGSAAVVAEALKATEGHLWAAYQELQEAEEELEKEIWHRLGLSFISPQERTALDVLKETLSWQRFPTGWNYTERLSLQTLMVRKQFWEQQAESWRMLFRDTTGSDMAVLAMERIRFAYDRIAIYTGV
jgi:hypothetical protein